MSFVDSYPSNLFRLAELERTRRGERLAAVLVRQPENRFDPNTIEVHVPAVGRVGVIDRATAARLAPRLDAGDRYLVTVEAVREDPFHPDRPGVDIGVARLIDAATAAESVAAA